MSTKSHEKEINLISQKIKELRMKAGYTSYETFSNDLEMQPKQYWRLESSHDFRISTLLRILEFHNISLEEFFKGMNEPL